MTASGGEAGIDGLGTVSETKSKLEQMRRSPLEKPRDCRAVVKAERQVSGRRHAVSCERCSADEVLCQMVLVKNKSNFKFSLEGVTSLAIDPGIQYSIP